MIDIHVHILPGVDDGARDDAMTAEMLERAADAGIRTIVCTPHVYRAEQHAVNIQAFPAVKSVAASKGIRLFSGCEFNYRALIKTGVENLDPFCMAGTKCILLEFSNDRLFPGWEPMICEIVENGYHPIIAHPERYTYIQKDMGIAEELCGFGCELQVDCGGLMAGMFGAERRTARKLLSQGMVSYIASDAHRPEHYDTFEKAYRTFKEEWPTQNRLSAMLAEQGLRRRRAAREG